MGEQQPDEKPEMSAVPTELYQGDIKKADVVEATRSRRLGLADAPGNPGKATSDLAGLVKPGKPAELKDLSRKSRVFLELLVIGHPTLEAYDLAGFKGSKHAAYQLRSDLRGHLAVMLESHGVSREDIKLELLKLLKLPTAATMVDVDTKLKLLKFMEKLTENEAEEKPKITPFLVNIESPTNVTVKG